MTADSTASWSAFAPSSGRWADADKGAPHGRKNNHEPGARRADCARPRGRPCSTRARRVEFPLRRANGTRSRGRGRGRPSSASAGESSRERLYTKRRPRQQGRRARPRIARGEPEAPRRARDRLEDVPSRKDWQGSAKGDPVPRGVPGRRSSDVMRRKDALRTGGQGRRDRVGRGKKKTQPHLRAAGPSSRRDSEPEVTSRHSAT